MLIVLISVSPSKEFSLLGRSNRFRGRPEFRLAVDRCGWGRGRFLTSGRAWTSVEACEIFLGLFSVPMCMQSETDSPGETTTAFLNDAVSPRNPTGFRM